MHNQCSGSCDCGDGTTGSAPRWLVGAEETAKVETPVQANDDEHDRLQGVFDDDAEDDGLFIADEEVEIEVAMDSGAVDHVIGPQSLPGNAVVKPSQGRRAHRNFMAANGTSMNNYGEVEVIMQGEEGEANNGTFAVTDVTRALHATSRVCDNDCSVLFTKGSCQVFKGEVKITGRKPLTSYRRKGGLYVRSVKLRAGRRSQQPATTTTNTNSKRQPTAKVGFTRPGAK